MKLLKKRQGYHVALLIISIVLGLSIVQTTSVSGQTACSTIRICETDDQTSTRGVATTKERGFPVVYSQTETFRPGNQNRYAEASLSVKSSPALAVLSVVFWFALLDLVGRICIKAFRSAEQK